MGLKRIMLILLNSLPNHNMKEPGSKQDPIIQRVHFINVGFIRNRYVAQYLEKIVQKYLHRWGFKGYYQTLTSHMIFNEHLSSGTVRTASITKYSKQQNLISEFSST